MKQNYAKLKTAMRHYLIGRGFFRALDALEVGLRHHIGTRKDGVTPEFQHQLEQASYFRTIEPLVSREMAETIYTVIFLHDTVEDPGGVDQKPLTHEFVMTRFGADVARAVELMTNHRNGEKKSSESYYRDLTQDCVAAICKGLDRMHNVGSMVGVFSVEKQRSYLQETEQYILPMLRTGRKLYPPQEPVFHNLRSFIGHQMYLIDSALKGYEQQK